MLTKEQMREALEWLGPVHPDVDDPERFACREALAAYSRVVALLEQVHDAAVKAPQEGIRYTTIKHLLRRTLEG
jgi:hypothetical protein